MSSNESRCIACRPDYKVLKLPYARGGHEPRQFSVYIYLPNDCHGLQSMPHKLGCSPVLLERSMGLTDYVPVGAFKVPKFTISYKMDASGMLRDLGLRLPFHPLGADFSEMLESPELFVPHVCHQSFVQVSEEGTEAAAVTAFGVFAGSASTLTPVRVVNFVAGHPFMFLIKEELGGVVVLAAQVVDPSISL